VKPAIVQPTTMFIYPAGIADGSPVRCDFRIATT
jgi:hypothetical protein